MLVRTISGLQVEATQTPIPYEVGLDFLIPQLDQNKGAVFASGTDYPGRYSRWDMGFINPPLEIVATRDDVVLRALRDDATVLLAYAEKALAGHAHVKTCVRQGHILQITPKTAQGFFAEEDRGTQPSVVSVLRALLEDFRGCGDPFLGLYGAFGYDLLFTFDPVDLVHARASDERLFHLYLPDRIYTVDRRKEQAFRHDYVFTFDGKYTAPLAPDESARPMPSFRLGAGAIHVDVDDIAFEEKVRTAKTQMACGNIFEVVLSRSFACAYDKSAAALYQRLCAHNPSPYQFMIQMGDEALVGTSPEMFVRIEGRKVESCPISGTVRRTGDPIRDADALKALLNSEKDEVELTMCTDVDRNDKARVCKPGSIKIIARRAIETYASLYHTVDHVVGELRDDVTSLDAFLSHMWAVTLTGAPKKIASAFIEAQENTPRTWYGGAIGAFLFNGNVNTGITIRTVHLKDGQARYRAGATLVYDSLPADEAAETRTKAQNFFAAFADKPNPVESALPKTGVGKTVILIDNDDSFVHMLADYIRQTGARTRTYRHTVPLDVLIAQKPDLVVHSPGPARPIDFDVPNKVRTLAAHNIPQFGVCLGLQGMVEAFGGSLRTLDIPRQGKPWTLSHTGTSFMRGVEPDCQVAAYHALYANPDDFPSVLEVLARNEHGVVMAIAHRTLPAYAVQFHPESLMSLRGQVGLRIVTNILGMI